MMKTLLVILALSTPIFAYVNTYPDCGGSPNTQPIIDIPPQLIDSVTNGSKYVIQSSENNTHLTILALKGSWYDMGYAYGALMKDELAQAIPGMFEYLISDEHALMDKLKEVLPIYLKWVPGLLKLDTKQLLTALLDLQHELTKAYTPQRFTDQMKGMADASGIDLQLLTRLNLIPELIRAQCSMAGIWGSASIDGNLVQLRALDWDYKAYILKFPTAVVYFSEEEGSNPFATFGFAGLIGALSGYSTEIAISEKVWLPMTLDPKSELGEPFTYVLRDLLQFGNDLESTMGILYDTPRTCRIHVGVGSKKDNSFEGLEISYNELNIFNDVNYTNYTDAHPQMNGVMFWDKHPQPSKNRCLGSVFQQNLGQINAEFLFQQAAALHQTGDSQVVAYDFANDIVYLAYSDPDTDTMAYVRPLVKLNMAELLTYENIF